MAKLDFPSSPTDGQVYAAPNGANYTWNATVGVWTAKAASALTLTSPGVISGTPQVGKTLAYAQGTADGGVAPYTYSWEWKKASDSSVLQVGSATYVIPASLIDDNVYVEITVTDSVADTDSGTTSIFPSSGAITAAPFPNSLFLPAGAPNASPPEVSTATLHGTGTCSSWEDGFTTLTSTGGILFSVNSGTFGTGGTSVSDGDTVDLIWDVAVVAAAADGEVLSGTLTDGVYTNYYSLTVTRGTVTGLAGFANLVDQPLSTAVTSDVVTPGGFNVPVSISFVGSSSPLTSLGVSVSGGAFSASPQTVNPGDTIQMQGTTGAANSTAYGVDITMGSPAATQTWTVTTTAVTPTIAQPTITSPANGSTDVNPAANSPAAVTLVSNTYTPLNGAGDPQTSSLWEVYENGYPLTSTNTITAVSSVSPSGANTWPAVSPTVSLTGGGNDEPQGWVVGNTAVVGGKDIVAYTTDGGTTWATASVGSGNTTVQSVTYYNGTWYAAKNGGGLYTSTNLSSWALAAVQPSLSTADLLASSPSGTIVAVRKGSANSCVSTDGGGTWTNIAAATQQIRAVYYGNGVFITVGNSGQIRRSTDGSTWATLGPFGGNSIQQVHYADGVWVASEPGKAWYSTDDGVNWTASANYSTIDNVNNVWYGSGVWVVSKTNSKIEYSTDNGLTWTQSSGGDLPTSGSLSDLVFVGNKWFALGQSTNNLHTNTTLLSSTTLTISGAQTDGFLSGDTVISNPAAAGPSTIISLDDTQVIVSPQDANWAIGQFLERDPATYTVVNGFPATVSAAPFTTIDIPQADLAVSSTYYARVQYATTNATAATSEFSAWSEFGTASEFVIPPGTEMGGGYFGGQINDGGTIYNLIVAPIGPVTQGANTLFGQNGGSAAVNLQYKTSDTADAPTATVRNDTYGGPTATALIDGVHPVYDNFINGATGPNAGAFDLATGGAGGGTGIGGYNDWYLPAKNELEILYYNLKPNTTSNSTSYGTNPNAVPPRASNYTAGDPAQTTATLFQSGGAQAFSTATDYWSSTEASNPNAWLQGFQNGFTVGSGKSNSSIGTGRAIRRVAA